MKYILSLLLVFGVVWVVWMDDKESNFVVKDFFPRKPYPTFFIDERGLKNPIIYDIYIEHSCLFIKAIGDDGRIEEDSVPLEIRRVK